MLTRQSGTVAKAISILNQFLEEPEGMTLSRLAQRTGIHKSTALRLCTTLERAGYLDRDAAMVYRVGPRIWQLAQVYRRHFRLEDVMRPILRALRDQTGESAALYVAEGDERVCLLRENSHHPIRHHLDEGARFPLAEGVVGRVLLAFLGAAGREYERIRAAGHLVDRGRSPNTASVAAPILLPDGSLLGALVVSGLQSRFDHAGQAHARELILRACQEVREQLPVEDAGHGGRTNAGSKTPTSVTIRTPAPVKG